jgi:hypothetical protein
MHQSLTISMSSSPRWKILWMSLKSNMTSMMPLPWSPNTYGWYRAHRVRSPSLHALMYQLCILCISLGTSVIAHSWRNRLPYSNFLEQSGKSGSALTQHPVWSPCQCGARCPSTKKCMYPRKTIFLEPFRKDDTVSSTQTVHPILPLTSPERTHKAW